MRFRTLLGTLDPLDDDRSEVRIASDLLKSSEFTELELQEIETWLTSFLADSTIVAADIKGLLNREMAYNPFDVSGRALLEAVARELRKFT